MSSDLSITKTTPHSNTFYSAPGVAIVTGIVLTILGILMLSKVKVLPEHLFRENISLEKVVKWGTLALGIILGVSGRHILYSNNAKTAPISSQQNVEQNTATNIDKPTKKDVHTLLKNNEITEVLQMYAELPTDKRKSEEHLICEWIDEHIAIPEKQNDIVVLLEILHPLLKDKYIAKLLEKSLSTIDVHCVVALISKLSDDVIKQSCIDAVASHYLDKNQFGSAYQFIKAQSALFNWSHHAERIKNCLKQKDDVIKVLAELTSNNRIDPLINILFIFPKSSEKDDILFAFFRGICSTENKHYLVKLLPLMTSAGAQQLNELMRTSELKILQNLCHENKMDDFYNLIIQDITKREIDSKTTVLTAIKNEVNSLIQYLFKNDDIDKLYTLLLRLSDCSIAIKKDLCSLIALLQDRNEIQKAVTLAQVLDKDGVPYIIHAIQYCLDNNLAMPQPNFVKHQWKSLLNEACRIMLDRFFEEPDFNKCSQILKLILWENTDVTNYEKLIAGYDKFPQEKQKGLFFLQILACYSVFTKFSELSFALGKKDWQNLQQSLQSLENLSEAIDACDEPDIIKEKMHELAQELRNKV